MTLNNTNVHSLFPLKVGWLFDPLADQTVDDVAIVHSDGEQCLDALTLECHQGSQHQPCQLTQLCHHVITCRHQCCTDLGLLQRCQDVLVEVDLGLENNREPC